MDDPRDAEDNAKEIARLVKAGYRVENITVKEFKEGPRKFGCRDIADCKNPNNPARKTSK